MTPVKRSAVHCTFHLYSARRLVRHQRHMQHETDADNQAELQGQGFIIWAARGLENQRCVSLDVNDDTNASAEICGL